MSNEGMNGKGGTSKVRISKERISQTGKKKTTVRDDEVSKKDKRLGKRSAEEHVVMRGDEGKEGRRCTCVRGVNSYMPAKHSLAKTIEVLGWKSVPI